MIGYIQRYSDAYCIEMVLLMDVVFVNSHNHLVPVWSTFLKARIWLFFEHTREPMIFV